MPSLVWAFDGADLIHDDWWLAATVHFEGVWDAFGRFASEAPARPGAAVWYVATFGPFGTNAAVHAIALAALNAVAAGLFFLVAERLLGRRVAVFAAAAWVVLPNRGSTRLWFAVATYVLAVCLVLLAALLAQRRHHLRPVAALLGAAVLTYEGVTLLALVVASAAAWQASAGRRVRPSLVIAYAAPTVAAAAVVYALSPKRTTTGGPSAGATETLLASQIGSGTFDRGAVAAVLGTALLALVTVALTRGLLPSFRTHLTDRDRAVLIGVAVLGAGAAPFLVTGWQMATHGLFDRAAIVPDLGLAIVLGAILAWVWSGTVWTPVLAVGVVAWMGWLNTVDIDNFRAAVRDGQLLVALMDEDVPVATEPLSVGPPLPNRGGVAQFVLANDLGSALSLRRGEPGIAAVVEYEGGTPGGQPGWLRYDWRSRSVTRPR